MPSSRNQRQAAIKNFMDGTTKLGGAAVRSYLKRLVDENQKLSAELKAIREAFDDLSKVIKPK